MILDMTQEEAEAWEVMWMAAEVWPQADIYGTLDGDRVHVMGIYSAAYIEFAISRAFLYREDERRDVLAHMRRNLTATKKKA